MGNIIKRALNIDLSRNAAASAAATIFGRDVGKFADGSGTTAVFETVLCRPHAAR